MANKNSKKVKVVQMGEETKDVVEETVETVDQEVVPEVPTIAEQKVVTPTSSDEDALIVLMDDYKASVESHNGLKRDKLTVIKFIKICKFLFQKDKEKLFDLFFKTLYRKDGGYLLSPAVVFQYLTEINDSEKERIQKLHVILDALRSYLIAPKKTGFPLDANDISTKFGSEGLMALIRRYLNL